MNEPKAKRQIPLPFPEDRDLLVARARTRALHHALDVALDACRALREGGAFHATQRALGNPLHTEPEEWVARALETTAAAVRRIAADRKTMQEAVRRYEHCE